MSKNLTPLDKFLKRWDLLPSVERWNDIWFLVSPIIMAILVFTLALLIVFVVYIVNYNYEKAIIRDAIIESKEQRY